MTRFQKVLLAFASLFFILTLYSFVRLDMWMLLICFTFHSVLLIVFSILCFRMTESPVVDEDEINDRIVAIKSEWASQTEELKKEIEKREAALQAANAMQEESANTIASLKQQLDSVRLELSEQAGAEQTEDTAPTILPPLPSDRTMTSTVNIIDIARNVTSELRDDAMRAGIQMNVSAPDDSLLVKADPGMLRILFRNIIDNSIKYMKVRGMLVITVSSIDTDIFVVCKDNGEGLAEQETKRIFELNYQGSNRISGNGLGLYQAKAIVDYYGGTIYAKSTPGKGMGIYIQLPST